MGPPIILLQLLLWFMILVSVLLGLAVVVGVAVLIRWKSKVKLRLNDLLLIAAILVFCFSISSFQLAEREENVDLFLLSDPSHTEYEGVRLHFGFPLPWWSRFEPYNSSFRSLFPPWTNINGIGIAINTAFWGSISEILIHSCRIYVNKSVTIARASSESIVDVN